MARQAENGCVEIAYGHHRLVALLEEYGLDKKVDLLIRDLNDEAMLKIMARGNMQYMTTDSRPDLSVFPMKKSVISTLSMIRSPGTLPPAMLAKVANRSISWTISFDTLSAGIFAGPAHQERHPQGPLETGKVRP